MVWITLWYTTHLSKYSRSEWHYSLSSSYKHFLVDTLIYRIWIVYSLLAHFKFNDTVFNKLYKARTYLWVRNDSRWQKMAKINFDRSKCFLIYVWFVEGWVSCDLPFFRAQNKYFQYLTLKQASDTSLEILVTAFLPVFPWYCEY